MIDSVPELRSTNVIPTKTMTIQDTRQKLLTPIRTTDNKSRHLEINVYGLYPFQGKLLDNDDVNVMYDTFFHSLQYSRILQQYCSTKVGLTSHNLQPNPSHKDSLYASQFMDFLSVLKSNTYQSVTPKVRLLYCTLF